jgi:hypothetical protein
MEGNRYEWLVPRARFRASATVLLPAWPRHATVFRFSPHWVQASREPGDNIRLDLGDTRGIGLTPTRTDGA